MPQRIAEGPDSVHAADAIRREQKRRDAWPYPHVYPPSNSIRRDPMGAVAAPALNTSDVILAFQVPSGFFFFMEQLGLYVLEGSAAWTFGQFTFTVDKNTPLGAIPAQSSPISDWSAIPFPMGDARVGPVRLPRIELFGPGDTIRAKINNATYNPGVGNAFGAWFGGWLVPSIEVPNAE